jgi:flagellar hook-associated protein 1 FlgK
MSVSGLMEIGRSALAAQTAAIAVTGENISNVNTPGYSRQRAILEAAPVDPSHHPVVGNGVLVAAVQRTYDRFLQTQINTAHSASGEQSTMQTALQRVEPLFGDLTGSGLGTSMQNFFSAWQDLAMNPQGAAERQSVLAKAQTLVDEFHQINGTLNAVKIDANQSLAAITSGINTMSGQIAELNMQISTAQLNGGNTNQLRDSRDLLIQSLSQKVGITCLEQSDGTVNVSLSRGPQLVSGYRSATLSLRDDPANSGLSSIILNPSGGGVGTDITPLVSAAAGTTGELGGTLQVRDSLVNGYLANLDELAGTLATQVNGVHASGFGLNGSSGVNFFTAPAAPVPPATFSAGFSNSIALNVTSTDAIAAAAVDPTQPGGGTGNNVSALAIADLAGKALSMTGGSNTLSGFYGSLVGKVGLAVQTSNQDATQNTALLHQLNIFRDSTSGVSLDEELIALTRYQKAFQGAARLITTGQEMMDTVLNMVR